jgi:glycosyltransferase involved in cell wall biosynthesis
MGFSRLTLSSLFLFISLTIHIIFSKPLSMEVEWVMQGRNFGFDGFMVEFLGYLDGFRKHFPHLRVVQSSFSTSFDDSPIQDDEYYGQLFPKEASNLQYFVKNESGIHNDEDKHRLVPEPKSVFMRSDVDASQFVCSPSSHLRGFRLEGGDLVRGVVTSAGSAESCCEACRLKHFCTAWTFGPGGCRLKGGSFDEKIGSFKSIAHEGFDSGTFLRNQDMVFGRYPLPDVKIFHGTTCVFRNMSVRAGDRNPNSIWIGRYMLERAFFAGGSTAGEYYVSLCSSLMDEIWVPTEWHKVLFEHLLRSHGHNMPDVHVIPEVVDTTLFDPASSPVSISSDGERVTVSPDGVISPSGSGVNRNPFLVNRSPSFEFLSVFKWELRKGYDILLDAYWKTFSKDDEVLLRLRTYYPRNGLGGQIINDNITYHIEELARRTLGKELSDLAPVIWEQGERSGRADRSLSRVEMRDLLASVDAFVLPTRGEGWGLPVAEAMAMALPVIVSNCSGPSAFAHADNAFLVPVHVETDAEGLAQPDAQVLGEYMRQVVKDKEEGGHLSKRKGFNARKKMESINAIETVSLMAERLRVHASRRGWTL